MNDRRSILGLTAALAASAAAHLAVLVPGLLHALTPRVTTWSVQADLTAERPQPHEREQPVLGIEQSPAATLTWIGYEQYQEHMAALSEVEQAAFDQPRDPGAPEDAVTAEPQPEETTAEIETETHEPQPSQAIREQVRRMFDLIESARATLSAPIAETDDVVDESPEAVVDDARPAEAPAEPEPVESEPAEPEDATAGEQQPAGDPADREADPTSTVDIPEDQWRLGRPLAAEGLELKPQRPHFSIVQRLLTSPRNPIVELDFDGEGVPRAVRFLEGSGSASLDGVLEASLYRWRAAGEALEEASAERPLTVRLRIILNRRAM